MTVYALFWVVLRLVLSGRGRYTTGIHFCNDDVDQRVARRQRNLVDATPVDESGDWFVVFGVEADPELDELLRADGVL